MNESLVAAVAIVCGTVLVILCLGTPDLLDALIANVRACK